MSELESIDLESISNEIKKQARAQAAKWFIASVVALVIFAVVGWWFYFKSKIITVIGGVPSGAVMAFDLPTKCPDGWSQFIDADGKSIIGVGNTRNYREQGGNSTHQLTVDEMPSHKHSFTGDPISIGGWNGDITYDVSVGDYSANGSITPSGVISTEGGSRPHNNMPPFLALYYCIKK